MKSILFVIVRTYGKQFKCNYLKNKKLFLDFLLHLKNLYQILNILKITMMFLGYVFPELRTAKDLAR